MTDTDTINITLSDIGKASGLNTALVRYYFGNKRGMLFALAERALTTSVASLSDIVASDVTATDKMKNYIRLLTDTYFNHRYLNRLWPHLCTVEDEFSEKLLNEFIIPVRDYVNSILDQGMASGEFKQVDKAFFSYQFMASCDALFRGSALTKKAFGIEVLDSNTKDRYAEHLTVTLLNGLARQ